MNKLQCLLLKLIFWWWRECLRASSKHNPLINRNLVFYIQHLIWNRSRIPSSLCINSCWSTLKIGYIKHIYYIKRRISVRYSPLKPVIMLFDSENCFTLTKIHSAASLHPSDHQLVKSNFPGWHSSFDYYICYDSVKPFQVPLIVIRFIAFGTPLSWYTTEAYSVWQSVVCCIS